MTTAQEDMEKWADEYLKKSKKNPLNGANPFDYVTIKLKEYRKLIKAEERIKAKYEAEYEAKIKELTDNKDMYQRWYREKSEALEQAKAQIAELLGIDEEKKDAE